jgi:D-alanyl-D-alanine dipeptidase
VGVPQVPIRECGEPLLDVAASPLAVSAPTRLRCGVIDRLVVAQSLLPRDVRLLVVDGHGSHGTHSTGGAVDLTLTADRADLPGCRREFAAPTSPLMVPALTAAGLVNDPDRWWHWSYGDRFWAFASRAPHARYGPAPVEERG